MQGCIHAEGDSESDQHSADERRLKDQCCGRNVLCCNMAFVYPLLENRAAEFIERDEL
jgi:hypothetical protein